MGYLEKLSFGKRSAVLFVSLQWALFYFVSFPYLLQIAATSVKMGSAFLRYLCSNCSSWVCHARKLKTQIHPEHPLQLL